MGEKVGTHRDINPAEFFLLPGHVADCFRLVYFRGPPFLCRRTGLRREKERPELQSRHPADSFRQLLFLPRPGQKQAQGQAPAGRARGRGGKGSDHSRQARRKRTGQAHLHDGCGRRDAAAGDPQDFDTRTKGDVDAVDRRRGGIRAPLGLRQTGSASHSRHKNSGAESDRCVHSAHARIQGYSSFARGG